MSNNLLSSLGERRILEEIIPSYADGTGDDCAVIAGLHAYTVLTTDPVPPPAAFVIGGDDDPYWIGWLLVTINASDIAASGAIPSSFLAALEMPSDFTVDQLKRLLGGVKDSCDANGLKYVGGNLREAKVVAGVGTAIGSSKVVPLTRQGARPGDKIVVVGEAGAFWRDVVDVMNNKPVDKLRSPLFSPVSQAKNMHLLHHRGLIRCAMDTSDGLAPSLTEIAKVNSLKINIFIEELRGVESDFHDSPERFWFGWGDWTVLAAVSECDIEGMIALSKKIGANITVIGEATAGEGVQLVGKHSQIEMARLESERFAPDSWFSKGVSEYLKILLSFPIPD